MRRFLKYCLILLLAAALPLLGYIWYIRDRGARQMEAAVTRLDAAGPWRWDDLAAKRQRTKADGTAPEIILTVGKDIGTMFTGQVYQTFPERPPVLLSFEQMAALKDELRKVERSVHAARSVNQLTPEYFHLHEEFTSPLAPTFPSVQQIRQCANLLYMDAFYQAQLGDLDQALVSCEAIWRIGGALEDELTLLPHLVRMAIEPLALAGIERTLAQGQPNPAILARLQSLLAERDLDAALRMGLMGERANLDRICQAFAEGDTSFFMAMGGTPPSRLDNIASVYLRITLAESHGWMLNHLTDMIEAIDLPEPQRSARLTQLDDKVLAAPALTRLFLPALTKAHEASQRVQARRDCALVALAVERFRRAEGRWPKALQELTPKFLAEVPQDPFAPQPLGYRLAKDGVVVYSVGPNGDLNGTHWDEARPSGMNRSYEFRLWHVAQRRQVPR